MPLESPCPWAPLKVTYFHVACPFCPPWHFHLRSLRKPRQKSTTYGRSTCSREPNATPTSADQLYVSRG